MAIRKRYVVAGTGGRGIAMYARPLLKDFPETAQLVGLFDHNATRLRAANEMLKTSQPTFTDFDEMLRKLDPDGVVVTTRDSTHAEFVVKTLEAGKRAYSEKPLCTTADQCRAIARAAAASSGTGFVTHNMRYRPEVTRIKELLDGGMIGELRAVEFRENLDRSHGAEYSRRWHRHKANSGGLLIHKASHHFDCLNWLAGSVLKTLSATGGTVFYGKNGPFRHGRCTGCPHAEPCDFYIDFSRNEHARKLYLEAEEDDGYIRDGCVYDERIDAEDQASVIGEYESGVRLTYSLLAFASYEGILMSFEGTKGRIEYESIYGDSWTVDDRIVPGKEALDIERLTLYQPQISVEQIKIPKVAGSHGGSDPVLRDDFFARPWDAERPHRMATLDEAIQAVMVGAAANESIARGGQPVRVQELLLG